MADERLIELKERAAAQFLRIPGVTAVGLGGRERNGRPTGEVVLKVFVERKRPVADLTPGQMLPSEFEGVGVDVVELPEPSLEQGAPEDEAAAPPQPGSPGTVQTDLDDTEFRPLMGGARVQVGLGGAGLGTLGCFLTDPADATKVYALTNFHVVNVKGGQPYYVREEEVPRVGTRLSLAFQRTRWYDGRPVIWLGTSRATGRGEAGSGLDWDLITGTP